MTGQTNNVQLEKISLGIEYGFRIKNSEARKKITLDDFKSLFTKDMINKIPDDDDSNILEIAILNSRYDIAEYLLTFSGWDLNHQDYNGETILQYVSQNRCFNFKIAMNLLDYDYVNFNLVDRWGNNPLQTSVLNFFSTRVVGQMKLDYYRWIFALKKKGFVANERTIKFAINVVKDQKIIDMLVNTKKR